MEQLKATEEELRSHLRDRARVAEEVKSLADAETHWRTERKAWEALVTRREELVARQCERLTAESGGAIRARVERYSNADDFVNGLKSALSGARVPASKLEALADAMATAADATDAGALHKLMLEELEGLAEFEPEKEAIEHRPQSPVLERLGLTRANLDGVARILTPEEWLTLSLTPVMSDPVFEYRAREQEYIPFRNASAGQQATALLTTLLNQTGPPLIIDQPEEDLDNPVMLEIVERVWEAKKKRQVIFASHNANLVVNGDAELVAWCNYMTAGDQSRGRIEGEGAIDVDETRNAIKEIMEGGEQAFNLRREKYGF
ncbi:MAG: AAA family ATPase [Rhodospirillaceae bacterium]|nr:AAA family ATPase [Rhodospirillaceae bacterium]